MGWDESPPTNHVGSCKRLKDEGLCTFKGMVGYFMQDKGEEHFKIVNHNVSTNDANEGKMQYAKYGKVGLNNSVCLSHSNILQMAYQQTCFGMKKYLGVTLVGMFFHICKSGQIYPNPTFCSIEVRRYEC